MSLGIMRDPIEDPMGIVNIGENIKKNKVFEKIFEKSIN